MSVTFTLPWPVDLGYCRIPKILFDLVIGWLHATGLRPVETEIGSLANLIGHPCYTLSEEFA